MNTKTIDLVVEAHYNDSKDCVCCTGHHRYATTLKTPDGADYIGGQIVSNYAKTLPTGSIIRVSVEQVR